MKFRKKYKNRKTPLTVATENTNTKNKDVATKEKEIKNVVDLISDVEPTTKPATTPTYTPASTVTNSNAKPVSSTVSNPTPTTETKPVTTNQTKTTGTNTSSTGKTYNYPKYNYYRVNYDYKGRRNKTDFPEFVALCIPSQESLKKLLRNRLAKEGYTEIISGNGYIYAKGTIPVLLTAHMDTVHKDSIKDFYEYYDDVKMQHIISSPQGIGGDDRCGIYMILEIIKTHKCSVLFCEDEESGGIGSNKFCNSGFVSKLNDMKYLIELDRKGSSDAVFYSCDNEDFTKFIEDNTGYKKAIGSFSDISNLSPACKVASVNLSCGYYNAHSTSEYVIVEEMLDTIEVVKTLLDVECEQFEYIEYKWNYGNWNTNRNSKNSKTNYTSYYDDYYDDYYGYGDYYGHGGYRCYYDHKNNNATKKETVEEKEEKSLFVQVYKEETIKTYVSNGITEDEAFGKFFINNSDLCFNDVFDYEWYDYKVSEDGWIDEL